MLLMRILLFSFPRIGNARIFEVALRAPKSKFNFKNNLVPKCNLGTRAE
jgi:hypothetical protein